MCVMAGQDPADATVTNRIDTDIKSNLMKKKAILYRVVHRFNQDNKLTVPHLYYAQCKVLLMWHIIGTGHSEPDAVKVILNHEERTKDKSFFRKLWEAWICKYFAR